MSIMFFVESFSLFLRPGYFLLKRVMLFLSCLLLFCEEKNRHPTDSAHKKKVLSMHNFESTVREIGNK